MTEPLDNLTGETCAGAVALIDSQSGDPQGGDLCCDAPHDKAALSEQDYLLSRDKAQRMADFLGFLADPNRLRILSVLAHQEMCVGDLAQVVTMNESAVSHQLRTLRAIRLVSARKQGRHVFYRLQDHHVLDFYQAVVEHLTEKY
jgi:ArsR family transcriptional regulator, lead/cadmium/zinc/bismuth-responsive transcriptional repressor